MCLSDTRVFDGGVMCIIYCIMYNYMFRLLTLAIFRLYIKYLLSSYTELKWTVYRGEVGGEVGTRSRCVMEVGRCGYMGGTLLLYIMSKLI